MFTNERLLKNYTKHARFLSMFAVFLCEKILSKKIIFLGKNTYQKSIFLKVKKIRLINTNTCENIL